MPWLETVPMEVGLKDWSRAPRGWLPPAVDRIVAKDQALIPMNGATRT